jgi:endonuclease/exonuclease/phosphatase family metal-dependent hydrolase
MPAYAPSYRLMTALLQDVNAEAGTGLGFTFPASRDHVRYQSVLGVNLPLRAPLRIARIDHLFVSRQFDVRSAQVLEDAAGSDHAPNLAKIVLP